MRKILTHFALIYFPPKNSFFDQLQEYDDVDLWHDLIDFSIDKPYFVHVLLHNIGTHVDPRILIERIENGREIPGLRDSLVQIMHDYQLQVCNYSIIYYL